ncbi:response regulator, partial [Tardiphaga sp.]|uniref:response regulator n=1 Tax=Tardiphaga sp. TaxID=1926292 RepID=UPI002621421B
AELHRSEQRYRLLFDACPLPMYLADIESHAVLAVNEAACAQYGYGRDEFLQLSLLDLRPNEDRLRFLAVTRALAKSQNLHERTYAGLWRHLQKNGTVFEVEIFACLTEYEGRPVHLSVALDVTARRRAERALRESQDQLRRAQKMEALGRFAGGIAHDFNNLLTGIVGSLDLMRTRLAQGRTENVARYIDAAMNSANRAAALTHRLLAFARRQPLIPKSIDANALVISLEDLLRRTIGERLDLEIVAAPDLWCTLCDPNQLESALLNLAINARDAMPDGGKLTIATANTPVAQARADAPALAPGDYICISVADTGTGMSAEVVARAFDPFFTTKPIGQGTGLGLSMIYGFARQSNGHVSIDSRPGRGTTVKLYLPRHCGVVAGDLVTSARDPAPIATGETVLVVEDEPVVRAVIMEMLHDEGYRVLEAVDGPSGLRVLRREGRIDLLVTDVGLPGMNGRQLADQARETRPGLKTLFITGYAESAAVAEGFLQPGMEMITKPFDLDNLSQRVREMVNR